MKWDPNSEEIFEFQKYLLGKPVPFFTTRPNCSKLQKDLKLGVWVNSISVKFVEMEDWQMIGGKRSHSKVWAKNV